MEKRDSGAEAERTSAFRRGFDLRPMSAVVRERLGYIGPTKTVNLRLSMEVSLELWGTDGWTCSKGSRGRVE
ncbi:hypothetical protein GUJ93_ZPchr0007g5043 [Zizania palustris]|uniref:Uncharacterized protein n=1 Tax=Zizania palustris TaxID=103762 RepID=A0A8J5TFX5_ZIZPA|nr:hypothetical protein GUJ93_ZPchr0007g5043 [Zizania palustris]